MTHLPKLVLFAVAGLSLVACERRDNGTTTMHDDTPYRSNVDKKTSDIDKKTNDDLDSLGKGGGPIIGTDGERIKARDRLASARCEHYKSCGNVAVGKKYDTIESCVTREKADLDKDWKLEDCPRVDTPRLDACITAVNAQKCDALFSSTPSECAESKVCIK
jgi:hypothetical protein